MSKIYKLKKLSNIGYISFEEETVLIDTVDYSNLASEVPEVFQGFDLEYDILEIPSQLNNLLIELLKEYDYEQYDEFLTFMGAVQNVYILYSRNIDADTLVQDFQDERKDFALLLKSLKNYLSSETRDNFEYVRFKFKGEKYIEIKNFFVINDIYKLLLHSLKINENTFESRSQELIEGTNSLKFEKGASYIKTCVVHFLYQKNILKKFSNPKALRFIGLFLHIAQIKVNNKAQHDIEFYPDLKDNLDSIDIKNLRHSLNKDRVSFYL